MGLMMEKSFSSTGAPNVTAADIAEWEAERKEWQAIAGADVVDAGKLLSDILLDEIDKAIASEKKEIKKVKTWLRQNRTQPRVFTVSQNKQI